MRSALLSLVVSFIKDPMMLLAAIDDHKAMPKLNSMPDVDFIDTNTPKNPKISMGKSPYPTVLITL